MMNSLLAPHKESFQTSPLQQLLFFYWILELKPKNLISSSNAETLMQLLMQVKWETTSQPAHTSFCQATHSPSLPMLQVLTITSLSAWLFDSMFNKELTAVPTVVLEVLSNTELWSFWLSREASPSYWQNQPGTPIPGASQLHIQSLLSVEEDPSTGERREHRKHIKCWRLKTVMDSHPSILISPARLFVQCRFSDCPKVLLFFHFCLSVWHVFLHAWSLPHCTTFCFLPVHTSFVFLWIGINYMKLFSTEKN